MTDDAGKPVTVLNPASGTEWPVEDFRFHVLAARLNAIRSASWDWGGVGIVTLYIVTSASGVLLSAYVLRAVFPGGRSWTVFVAIAVTAAVTAPFLRRSSNRLRERPIGDAILREGLCAACGYNLIDADSSLDGLRTCSECGAAWRSDRIERIEAFGGSAFVRFDRFPVDKSYWPDNSAIKDAVGRVQPMINFRKVRRVARRQDPSIAARIADVMRRTRRASRPYRWAAAFLLMTIVVAAVHRALGWSMFTNPLGLVPMALVCVLAACLLFVGPHAVSRGRFAHAMAQHGVCPACSNALPLPDKGSDSLVTCRTCLATWRAGAFAES